MTRAIHGAPGEALRQALEALAQLSFWISWTADPDLAPEPVVSARCMRDAANALRKAAGLLDQAADRADRLPSRPAGRCVPADDDPPGAAPAVPPPAPGQRKNSNPRRRPARPGRAHAGRRGPRPRLRSVHPWRFE